MQWTNTKHTQWKQASKKILPVPFSILLQLGVQQERNLACKKLRSKIFPKINLV